MVDHGWSWLIYIHVRLSNASTHCLVSSNTCAMSVCPRRASWLSTILSGLHLEYLELEIAVPSSLLSLLLECSSKLHCSQTPQAPILHVARPKQQSSLLSILSSIFFLWFHGSMTVQYCPIALYNVFIMTCRSWCWVHTGIRLPEACTEPDDFRCFSERTR